MSSRSCVAAGALALALIFSASIYAAERTQQQPVAVDQTQIIDDLNTVFAAARTDDVAKFNSVIAPGFYIFDGGTRFDGDAVMGLIKAQHAAGKRFEWNVTEPDVRIDGNTAWIAYVNQGSITDASGTVNQKWLESAVLEKQAGNWKIVFMHSTRVPSAPKENHGK
jgi:hypothetical protein